MSRVQVTAECEIYMKWQFSFNAVNGWNWILIDFSVLDDYAHTLVIDGLLEH